MLEWILRDVESEEVEEEVDQGRMGGDVVWTSESQLASLRPTIPEACAAPLKSTPLITTLGCAALNQCN